MCTLAHVFEAAGLATVVFSSVREVVEKMKPPRALHCQFPLGRPLGRPRDPEFQHAVLAAALELLKRTEGPILEDYPETIESAAEPPMACPLPARYDPNLHPAVDEAQALRGAYDRAVSAAGRTSVGRVVAPDGIAEAVAGFVKIAEGAAWNEVGLPGDPVQTAHDIRSYYEELAIELADGPPGPWAAERWFYDVTQAGQTLLAARRAMKDAKAPFPLWFYMAPGART